LLEQRCTRALQPRHKHKRASTQQDRTGLAAARRASQHEHAGWGLTEERSEALQLRFAVEERALAFSLVLARLARSGSKRYAAAPRL
jgi:hypothetical protein